MAEFPHDARLNRLKKSRSEHKRIARRHRRRRLAALARGDKSTAGRELKIYRRHREAAQRLQREIEKRRYVLRARKKANWLKRHTHHNRPVKGWPGVVWFDGKMCAAGIAKELQRIRNAGRWKGVLVSGFRTPAYSRSLCYARCGRPSCPGTCAGEKSNHSGRGYGRKGAADLTDFYTFKEEARRLGSWLENHLPYDPVHFSDSGY